MAPMIRTDAISNLYVAKARSSRREEICLLAVLACATVPAVGQVSRPPVPSEATSAAAELKKLFDEDQADRAPAPGKNIDWEAVSKRDDARERRVKELLRSGALQSGADYFHGAMVLQHALEPNDYLLAHELCVVAIGKGEERAKWLAAASLDRFLVAIGRQQRFGTQFISKRSFHPPKLAPVDPDVPDQLRRDFNVPSLAEARAKEALLAKEFEEQQRAQPGLLQR
jgi:hypothetical protein